MKVFKFHCGQSYYVYAAKIKQSAIDKFTEDIGDLFIICEEIPQNEWDDKKIIEWEDNDLDSDGQLFSIRETIIGDEPQLIFSNDMSNW